MTLQHELITELDNFLQKRELIYPSHELLKIDLHCHDYNSDVPDELEDSQEGNERSFGEKILAFL
jgi:hypothetical protein